MVDTNCAGKEIKHGYAENNRMLHFLKAAAAAHEPQLRARKGQKLDGIARVLQSDANLSIRCLKETAD